MQSVVDANSSVVGEEDPGAGLESVRGYMQQQQMQLGDHVQMVCRTGGEELCIEIRPSENSPCPTFTHLLELVVGHHNSIADAVWDVFQATGQHQLEVAVCERVDGTLAVKIDHH